MGHFYTNVAIHGVDHPQIVDCARTLKRRAFVGPTQDRTTFLYDEATEAQVQETIISLAKSLSAKLKCTALGALNHDDDMLRYWLFENGLRVDGYNSAPGLFGDETERREGDAAKLATAFGAAERVNLVAKALHESKFAFAFERHQEIARILGLDPGFATIGFVDIARGDVDQRIKEKMTLIGQ